MIRAQGETPGLEMAERPPLRTLNRAAKFCIYIYKVHFADRGADGALVDWARIQHVFAAMRAQTTGGIRD